MLKYLLGTNSKIAFFSKFAYHVVFYLRVILLNLDFFFSACHFAFAKF